jgi:hypothetical protein
MNEFMFLKYFIPQTWFAGRLFLGAMFAIAIAGYPLLSRASSSSANNKTIASLSSSAIQNPRPAEEGQESKSSSFSSQTTTPSSQHEKEEELPIVEKRIVTQKMPKIIVAYLAALTIVSAYIAISSLFIVFPGSVIDNFPIHRPYEIPALGLFLVALFYFYKINFTGKVIFSTKDY